MLASVPYNRFVVSVARVGRGLISLFVSNRRAARSSEVDELEAFESGLTAPFAEVRPAEVEGFAKLYQHVQRHKQAEDVFAPRIVNDILDSHESAARWQRVVGGANQAHLLLQIPVMEDHAHRNNVRLGQRVF